MAQLFSLGHYPIFMSNRAKLYVFLAVMTVALVPAANSQSSFIGDTVSVSRQWTSLGYTFGPVVYVVKQGPLDTVALTTGNNLYLNVEASSLQFTFGPDGGSGGYGDPMDVFIQFQDLSPAAPIITGLSYDSDLSGFGADRIFFTDHSVTIGIGGISWFTTQPGYLTVNLQVTQVPEPTQLELVGIGVILLAVFKRGTLVPSRF